ncbi:MAG TPA: MarR family transcriptional regulator [Gemmatimonadaceae bacterium]|nr:MarR family transcriptional regulator [Gemmatimonadaceae bacterium]
MVLTRASNALHRKLNERIDLHDLTLTEFGILEALYHKGPLLLGDVQRKILLSSGGVTYTVDRLAEKGLVERRECPSDRRARYAALTPKGEALISEIFPEHADQISALMSVVSAKEQGELVDLLKRLGLSAASE